MDQVYIAVDLLKLLNLRLPVAVLARTVVVEEAVRQELLDLIEILPGFVHAPPLALVAEVVKIVCGTLFYFL